MFKLLSRGTAKLYTASDSKSEYKTMIRTLNGENKTSTLEAQVVNDTLLKQACETLTHAKEINVIHDPSDIRKPHSKKTENLGKVRDLKGNIINGYSTHNAVAIVPTEKAVHLLSHRAYSNKDVKFLKKEFIAKLEKNKAFDGDDEAKKLYESGDYFNKKTIGLHEIEAIGTELKNANPDALITHVLDREFDDTEYFKLIDETLSQHYIARGKKSRISDVKDPQGKSIKLIDAKFDNYGEKKFQKLHIAGQCIQDGKIVISWQQYSDYNAVKIKVYNRTGQSVFDDGMLLLTNKVISSFEDADQIYLTYLKRGKIEYVFKFLKEGLGWEDIQIQDFKAIQKILSLCFYVASYLYEIGEEKTYDDYAILLAEMGGGKGKVTRHFITQGIRDLLNHYRIGRFLKAKEVSQAQQDAMCNAFGGGL